MNGQRVGTYEIVRMLARGGMAVVYLVHQPALDRDVVLKRLDLERDDPTLAQRFVREARLAAALDHPNIVTLFDFFEDDGVPYIAMEYVAGGSLRSLVGTLELPQVLGVLEGTLAGLAHAERHGIAHRDLKPENVLITRRGNVKIADFGIARAYNALSQRLTVTGKAMGTPIYMAPEQALDHAIGPQTDLYALGVIVYELLTGRPPFESDSPMGVLYCHVHKPPPPLPRSVRPRGPRVGRLAAGEVARGPAAVGRRGVAGARGDRGRRARPVLAPRGGDHHPDRRPRRGRERRGARRRRRADHAEDGAEADAAAPGAPPAGAAASEPAALRPAVGGRRGARRARGGRGDHLTPGGEPAARTDGPAARQAAIPYDFDRDGRLELVASVLRASPHGSRRHSGVVLLRHGDGWTVITEKDAGLPGRPGEHDEFGSGLASGDFDRDGAADLAIGTPGRNRVSVLFGTGQGAGGWAADAAHGPAPVRSQRSSPAT